VQSHCHPLSDSVTILSMRIGRMDESQCIERILAGLAMGQGGWVITTNTDILRRYVLDPEFHAVADRASFCVADGMPLVWASKLQGSPLPARVAGSNLIGSLCAAAAPAGRSIYLLGGDPGTAEATRLVLQQRCPGLLIVGTHCPAFGFEQHAHEVERLRQRLLSARPDIVFVALGSPKQELLINQLRDCLPSSWWLGIGISFSFMAGRVKRAPPWMQRAGIEWLHRLLHEPRRLAKRYLVHDIPFALRMLTDSLLAGLRQRWLDLRARQHR
jgi:N-acetylglucosaminyldiphosphoundecaprenol N-acetyl-beta-D-mannosaminyltransferase